MIRQMQFFIGCWAIAILPGIVDAGEPAPLDLSRIGSAIKLDGIADEPAWQVIQPLPMTMHLPTFEGAMTERTEIRVAYDAKYLYISGKLYDSAPEAIQLKSLYRDDAFGQDRLGIFLDTFNDDQNGLHFFVNSAGVRTDVAVSNDGGTFNVDWNTFWDAVCVRDTSGWSAEIRIPFSSLGFQSSGRDILMGLMAYRDIARKNEQHVFPALSPERNIWTSSRAQDVRLNGIRSQKPVYVTPYVLGGVGRSPQLNAARTIYHSDNDFKQEIGGDIKYNLTSNLTLDLTLNTDFAQVEADNQQVNLNRFSLFFPEKRRFFQERSGIFSFNTLGFSSDRLFHSRRIGLSEDNAVIPIIGGARLVGKVGKWDVGLIDMQTARKAGTPSENFGVLRLQKQSFNPSSFVGGIFTSRVDENGKYNLVYGLDSYVRIYKNEYFRTRWAQSFDQPTITAKGFQFLRTSLAQIQYERRINVGLSYWFGATRGGADYKPGIGFTTRENFTELGWSLSYDWFLDDNSALRRINPFQPFGFVLLRNFDKSVESALIEYDTDFEWKSGARLGFDLEWHYEDLRTPLLLPEGTMVPAGSYSFFKTEGDYSMPNKYLLTTSINWAFGRFYDGWRADFGLSPVWNLSHHFALSSDYSINHVRFPDRDQSFTAHIARLRIQTAVNTKMSLNAFLQFSSAGDAVVANLRFRYNFIEGNDFWIVYNEGLNVDRDRVRPALPLSNDRTVLLKYTYTLQM